MVFQRLSLVALPCCFLWSLATVAQESRPVIANPVALSIYRLHSGSDCVSGELLIDGKVVAYALERPWEGNIPIISSIPNGRYDAFIRTDTDARWKIEFKDVPNREHIQIHIGNTTADSIGCILVGKTLSKDLCTLGDSEKAFNAVKLAFASASAASNSSDTGTPLRVTILDYSDGAAFLDSNLSAKSLLVKQISAQSSASKPDIATLWTVNGGTRTQDGQLSAASIEDFADRHPNTVSPLLRGDELSPSEVRSGLSTGLDVAAQLNGSTPLLDQSAAVDLTESLKSTLLDTALKTATSDSGVQAALAETELGGSLQIPILPTGQVLLEHASDADRTMVMNIVGALKDRTSGNQADIEAQISSAVMQRLTVGHEAQVRLVESVVSANPVALYEKLKKGDIAVGDAVTVGSVLLEQVAGRETAKRFQNVYGAVQQFQSLSVAFKLGTLSPASLLNGYVAAASILGALAGPSQSDNAPVLEAIGKLSQQISEMRQEMNSRFDILEQGQQNILQKLDVVLKNCETNQKILTTDIQGVSRDLAALQYRIDTHNREASLLKLSRDAELMRTYARGEKPADQMQESINTALVDFYLHATQTSIGVDFSGKERGKKLDDAALLRAAQSTRQIEYLAGLLPEYATRLGISLPNTDSVPNPVEWERGTRAYLQTRLLFPTIKNPQYDDQLDAMEQLGMTLQAAIATITSPANLDKATQAYSDNVNSSTKAVLTYVSDFEKENGPVFLGAAPTYQLISHGDLACHPCEPWTYAHVPQGLPILQTRTQLVSFTNDPIKLAVDLKIAELRKLPKRPGSVQGEYKVTFLAQPYANQDAPFELLLDDFNKSYIVFWPGAATLDDRIVDAMNIMTTRIAEVEAARRATLWEKLDKWVDTPDGQSALAISSVSAVQAAASVVLSLHIDTGTGDLSSSSDLASLGTPESMKAFLATILSRPASTQRIALRDDLPIETQAQIKKVSDLANGNGKSNGISEIAGTLSEIEAFRNLSSPDSKQ